MEEKKKNIEEHEHGVKTDTESYVSFESSAEAQQHFRIVKARLLNVSGWREISKVVPSDFKIVDLAGNEVNRPVQEGDYFKIDIPGPGSDSGDGHDWVKVHQIEESGSPEDHTEIVSVRVAPSTNPQTAGNETSHFFDSQASSTFMARREGNKVFASVHGRNENPNTETENLTDKVRNTFVALGAMLGFSKAQWKSLVEGLVEKEP